MSENIDILFPTSLAELYPKLLTAELELLKYL